MGANGPHITNKKGEYIPPHHSSYVMECQVMNKVIETRNRICSFIHIRLIICYVNKKI
jgi:hypothetical protein